MIIATYNVNGINGRLPVLLRWLNEKQPDIVCLQELKAPEEKFPNSKFQIPMSQHPVSSIRHHQRNNYDHRHLQR
jgi:exonuclease III